MPSAREAQRTIASSPARPEPRRSKPMTIGAVCKSLSREFPEISISKIRYLENQRLIDPRRTPGGYRLYSTEDVARLRTILRLQRDEFLPLRVIRQELAVGRTDGESEPLVPGQKVRAKPRRLPPVVTTTVGPIRTLDELLEATGAELGLVRELESYGIIGTSGDTKISATLSAPRSSWRAMESAHATSASSRHRPIANLRCSSSCSPRRSARAVPSAATKRPRLLRTLLRSQRT